jgi:hypothetical protein
MPRFVDAPEVEAVARRVIAAVGQHLWLGAHVIRYGIREAQAPKSQGGRTVPGTVRVLGPYEQWLAVPSIYQGERPIPEATVVVERLEWDRTKDRDALLDHLLSHLDRDDDGDLCVVRPDVAEFAAVIARRGAWNADLLRCQDAWRERALPLEETDAALALQAPPGRVVPLRRAGGEG